MWSSNGEETFDRNKWLSCVFANEPTKKGLEEKKDEVEGRNQTLQQ